MKANLTPVALIIGAAIVIAGTIAAAPDAKEAIASTPARTGFRSVTPTNSLLSRICGKATHQPKPAAINTDSLKGSDWYSTVMADIARKRYYIATKADGKAGSINAAQGMKTDYAAGSFTLTALGASETPTDRPFSREAKKSRHKADSWQLDLTLKGLYADGALACAPDKAASRSSDTSEVRYSHRGLLTVQYQNTGAGVRQNFIVERAPAANVAELRVKLRTSTGWVMNEANDRELHFAKRNHSGGLSTKVIYKDLNVWDAAGKALPARLSNNGNEVSIIVASAGAKYPVIIDPLATTAATTLSSPMASGNNFGTSVASAGDVNADGYSDVIVSTYNSPSSPGTAYIYHGSSTGLSTTVSTTLSDPLATNGDSFGWSVASAGDVNGDGYSDVIVGAFGTSNLQGKAYVYYGGSTGLSTTVSVTLSDPLATNGDLFGGNVACAGDVNADGYSDVVVAARGTNANKGKAYVYHGSSTGLSAIASTILSDPLATNGDLFSIRVASAGDVNGDGYSDVIVGASGANVGNGTAYVYHGSATGIPTTASTTLSVPAAANFGFCVASAGDVNADGYSDVIVGAIGTTSNQGTAYVYYGSSTTGLSTTVFTILSDPAAMSNDDFGYCVASVGDVNGDGYSDVIVGNTATSTTYNKAYVYYGSSAGIPTAASAILSDPTVGTNRYFGTSAASAGDVNGDGYSDVIVGAFGSEKAFAYLGGAGGIQGPATNTFSGTSGSSFGRTVASAGDVNGDGYNDVIIGVYTPSTNGNVYLYLGTSSGLSTTAATTLTGPSSGSDFGFSIASAGDVNGDGYNDVIVGAPYTAYGNVYVYLGSATGLSATAATTYTGYAFNASLGVSVASAGDVNGDGYSDVIVGSPDFPSAGAYSGAAYIYLGSPSGLSTTANITLANNIVVSHYGCSVASAGDVNGDGYSDVIVGAYSTNPSGSAYVYLGSPTGLATTAANTYTGPSSGGRFGISVASAGDVNGDGYNDVIVGANATTNGNAYVYNGSSTGLSATAAITFTGPSSGSNFGISVASVGDVNGDGYSDMIIGANATTNGSAYVYHGSPTGLSATAATTLSGPSSGSSFGVSVAGAGDVNGDGYSDVIVGAYNTAIGNAYLYAGNGGYGKRNNSLRLYNTNLTSPLSQSNRNNTQFGVGLFVRPFAGATQARLVWETEKEGVNFMHNSPITNYTGYTAGQASYTTIPPAGVELKTLISKVAAARATKVRVRIQYLGSSLPNGQTFGSWVYPQSYLSGAMGSGVQFGFTGQPLPVGITAFDAKPITDKDVLLSWSVANPKDATAYTVERSSDGMAFSAIGTAAATLSAEYLLHDGQPLPGRSCYRLRIASADGSSSYSEVRTVFIGKGSYINVYPSPAKDYMIIETSRAATTATISNMQGQVVMNIATVQSGTRVNIAALAPVLYVLKTNDGQSFKITKE